MKRWYFSINPFLTATKGSYRAMRKICIFTANALNADPTNVFLQAQYVLLIPFVNEYKLAFTKWLKQRAFQLGETNTFLGLLDQLRGEKIRKWDVAIQAVYDQGTSKYIALLPHNRTPFQTGSQDDIMSAVAALSLALENDPKLADTKTDIDAFDTVLKAAFESQKKEIQNTKNASKLVEAARVNVAVKLYGILGTLMNHFEATPETVETFFDMQTMRNHEQTIFRSKIGGGKTLNALTHTFDADEEFIADNRENTTLRFWLAKNEADLVGDKYVDVPPKSKEIILVSNIGDTTTDRFLKVQNLDANLGGAYTIELL